MNYLIILQGGFIVLKISDKILLRFYSVFTYEAAFNRFVIAVIGFIAKLGFNTQPLATIRLATTLPNTPSACGQCC